MNLTQGVMHAATSTVDAATATNTTGTLPCLTIDDAPTPKNTTRQSAKKNGDRNGWRKNASKCGAKKPPANVATTKPKWNGSARKKNIIGNNKTHTKNSNKSHRNSRWASRLTKKAEPPPTRDVNRDSGTASANGGWLRRLVRLTR